MKITVGSSTMFLVFVIATMLKLAGVIDWSWWIVTMPLWIPFATIFIVGLLAIVVFLFYAVLISYLDNKQKYRSW